MEAKIDTYRDVFPFDPLVVNQYFSETYPDPACQYRHVLHWSGRLPGTLGRYRFSGGRPEAGNDKAYRQDGKGVDRGSATGRRDPAQRHAKGFDPQAGSADRGSAAVCGGRDHEGAEGRRVGSEG